MPTARAVRRANQLAITPAVLSLLALSACSSSDSPTGTQDPPAEDPEFLLDSVSNGFGQQLPHIVQVEVSPGQFVREELRSIEDLLGLVSSQNLIEPTVGFPSDAVLPNGQSGNQFFLARFTNDVDLDSDCLEGCTGTGPCDFDTLEVVTFDPASHEEIIVPARIFVGGYTRNAAGDLEQWVKFDGPSGELRLTTDEAIGFPGSASQLPNVADFVAPSSIMVVMDSDDDLSTLEAFPSAETVQLRIPGSLCSTDQQYLETPVVAATVVGSDPSGPSVVTNQGDLVVLPRDGMQAVDPTSDISIRFTEAIQPWTLGSLTQPGVFGGAVITQAPNVAPEVRAFTIEPRSPYDLTQWLLKPELPFNGLNPAGPPNFLDYAEVQVSVGSQTLIDLQQSPSTGPVDFSFLVDRGAALTNAPIVPQSLVISRGGMRPGISVLDLNGFGQSTGNPASSLPYPLLGESRFPYDPNVTLNPAVRPLLTPGTTTLDGGSAGVFTLTLDVNLNSVLAGAPILADASDMQYGASLDQVFNNAPPPFGCQAGGGNVCVLSGLKSLSQNPDAPVQPGFPNLVSFAPHPNPPPLSFPPSCLLPFGLGADPSSVDSGASVNLLQSGNPFPDPTLGTPPTGLLDGRSGPEAFYGPSFGQTDPQLCSNYGVRQQIGQFLYVADQVRGELVALNSNRMLPIERVLIPGITSMALSPNLDVLAVTSQETDTVTLLDVDPNSATFHTVLARISVGDGPRGVAFDPLDEDILVCNEFDSTISVISALSATVRKTVPSRVDAPFELVVTPRMAGFAFDRNVYFAFILGRNGEVAVYESGPDGPNGWGYDTTVGVLPFVFQAPRAIVLDPLNLDASFYVAYEGPVDPTTGASGPLGVGAISRVRLDSASMGQVPLQAGSSPSLRDMEFRVVLTLSEATGEISGTPASLAFDELRNFAEYPSPVSIYTSGSFAMWNGKALIREVMPGSIVPTNQPKFLFAAIPGEDVVDVLQLGLAGTPRLDVNVYSTGTQSIPVPNVRFLTGYFSQ